MYGEKIQKEEVAHSYKYQLVGDMRRLVVDKTTIVFKSTYEDIGERELKFLSKVKVKQENKRVYNIELYSVLPEDIAILRKNNSPSLIIKKDGMFLLAEIPAKLNIMASGLLGTHKCSMSGHECRRLSAAPDELGGCAKVRQLATGIEKYPWIKTGYETFGTKNNAFVVIECDHYEECPKREKKSALEINKIKESLADYLWMQ